MIFLLCVDHFLEENERVGMSHNTGRAEEWMDGSFLGFGGWGGLAKYYLLLMGVGAWDSCID